MFLRALLPALLAFCCTVQVVNAGLLDRIPFGKKKQIEAELARMEARATINAVAWPLLKHPALIERCEGGRASYGFSHAALEGYEVEGEPEYEDLGFVPRQILAVQEDSPAQAAGLMKGDVILKFNGKKLKDHWKGDRKLNELIEEARDDGDTLKLDIERDGAELSLTIEPIKACDFEAVVGGSLGMGGGHTMPGSVRNRVITVDIELYRLVANDTAALQSVVVHELAHHFQGHIKARALKAGIGRGLDTVLGMAGGVSTGGALGMAGGIAFKPSEEREADVMALALIDELGLQRTDYVALVHKIGTERPDLLASVIGAHPVNEERLAALPKEGEG